MESWVRRGAKIDNLETWFILKGAEMPLGIRFTPRFLGVLRQVCRKYQGDMTADDAATLSNPFRASDVENSPHNPAAAAASALKSNPKDRKSERWGPAIPIFDALSPAAGRHAECRSKFYSSDILYTH
jgi:hypothetical protein